MASDTTKVNLLGKSQDQLEQFFAGVGEKPYRARQLLQWVYQRGVTEFAAMTDLSKGLRAELESRAAIELPRADARHDSVDGTVKWLFESGAGQRIETVFIPEPGRGTLCISSQVGCALDCAFCATGAQGFNRNLTSAEIVGQVWHANRELPQRDNGEPAVTNVVLMGMGEPLYNFDAVMDVVDVLMDDLAFGISKRRVTVSTAGVVPRIYDMADRTDAALAISLHAPDDDLRSELVPLNRKYPIGDLLDACRYYLDKVGERRSVTIEYALLAGVNDSLAHAKALARRLRTLRCKVNLIPFNPFPASGFERPDAARVREFQTYMMNAGYATMLRATRGDDIGAACGQLVGQVEDRTRRQARYIARLRDGAAQA